MEVTDFRWPISAKYGGRPCQNGWSLRTEAVRTMCGQRTAHSPHALTTTSRAGRWMGRTWWCACARRCSLHFSESTLASAAHIWASTRDQQRLGTTYGAFRVHHRKSVNTRGANKSSSVIKPPGDEKEERPSLSYKDLITEAIERSLERRLKLSEIYQVE
ncbi:hypothetical protein niasHS_004144 [Heterodera schachtii]|uniref:Uncharacterized protein n=1 Tax=Heterodera schachtii TaxID=97005 RepID=A0ABD2JKX4_HETSC